MSGWWDRASTEQRLAQVEAGIELGMTSRQVGMVSGSSATIVLSFANNHARYFGPNNSRPRVTAKRSASAAYFRGEAVDFWRSGVQDRADRHEPDIEEVVLE